MFPDYSPPFFEQIYSKEMPSEWKWVDITNISKPKQWETIPQSSFTDNGYPVYGANGRVGFYSTYNHEDPVIAISCRGACGDLHLTEPFSYVSGNAMCLDDLSEDIEQKFLFYALIYRGLKDTISGSAQPQITRENLKGTLFPHPPLPEQKKIASILTSVDEVIEKTQSQIDKLQNLKKATMNELLTRGIGHTEFKDSELGRIPKSWEVRPLREICDVCSSKRVMQSDYVDKGVPFFRSKEIILKSKGEAIQSVLRISEDQFLNLSSKFGAPKSDDILITAVGTIGISYLVGNERFYFKDGNLLWLRNVESIFPSFLSVFLSAQNTRERIIEISGGSSQSALTIDKLSDFLVPIPSQLEQKQIFDTTNVLEGYIGIQKKKLSQTQSLKKSLMQDLLTGKVRVSVN